MPASVSARARVEVPPTLAGTGVRGRAKRRRPPDLIRRAPRCTTAPPFNRIAHAGTPEDRRRGPRHGRHLRAAPRRAARQRARRSLRARRHRHRRSRPATAGAIAACRARPLSLVRRSGGAGPRIAIDRRLRRADRRRGRAGASRRVVAALDAGKPVVTANKALLARHGVDLARRAEKAGVALNFEAAVAGGVPIVKTLRESLVGNAIDRVYGILNGTCNYILTRMEAEGLSFDECLARCAAPRLCGGRPDLRHRRLRHRPQARHPDQPRLRHRDRRRGDPCRGHRDDHHRRSQGGRRARLPHQAARRRDAHARAASSSASTRRWCRNRRRSRRSTASPTPSRSMPTRCTS